MRMSVALGALALGMMISAGSLSPASAAILGTPSSDPSFSPNSTNELNFLMQVPGREGQDAPYVEQIGSGPGEIELFFSNLSPALAFFERRINGQQAGSTAHPVVAGDTIHPGTSVAAGTTAEVLFFVPEGGTLDIRLALGGERDWDFDWTSFTVQPIPVPASLPLLLGALCALGVVTRRRRG